MGKFDGKVVIITGGGKSKSIGYGIATAFAKEGAKKWYKMLLIKRSKNLVALMC